MKRIYKYSKKGKRRNNQKTKTKKKFYEMQNLINPNSIDQTNKSNLGF